MNKLICPHCSVYTAFNPVRLRGRGIVLRSSSDTHTDYEKVDLWAFTDDKEMSSDDLNTQDYMYAILMCQSCDKWYVARTRKYSNEWSAVYPILHPYVADEIPEPIKSEFEEANLCFAVGAYRGCILILICKTALIDMQREQGVSNLKGLMDKGSISQTLYRQADQVRLWGNLIGHNSVPLDVAAKEDVEQLLEYLRMLLDTIYVQPKHLSNLTEKLEEVKKNTKSESPGE